jgi:GntR family transcriptional regulator/MocR family aminotransferase
MMTGRPTCAADLDVLLAMPDGRNRSVGLQSALRHAIRCGLLRAGTRLPSTRVLAGDLGMARTTVVDAYTQLAAEGWLCTRPASATIVAEVPSVVLAGDGCPDDPVPRGDAGLRHDLRPSRPARGSFPRREWWSAIRTVLATAADEVWDYGHHAGRPELRRELAEYLGRVRGVRASPSQLVICAGFRGALDLATALRPAGHIATEAVGSPALRAILLGRGLRLQPVPADADGMITERLPTLDPRPSTVLVTPAHQFAGGQLSPARGAFLLRWIGQHDAIVIEDDYDGEFRQGFQRVSALQSLDPDRVAFAGTASMTMAPALRLGWLVLPAGASGLAVRQASPVPVITQLAMAELLRCGAYDRHVRRMRESYRRRRDLLIGRLAAHVPRFKVPEAAVGTHVVLELPDGVDESDVLAACADRQVAVAGVRADGYHAADGTGGQGLIVGYSAPATHGYSLAVDALIGALRAVT